MATSLLDVLSAVDGSLLAIDDGTLRLSYADVQRLVESERLWLQSMQVRRCALLAENGAGWILSDLALLACEAVNVPLPPAFTREQVTHVLDDAEIDSVLTDRAEPFLREHPTFTYASTSCRTGFVLLRREIRRSEARSWASGISKVTYTSGSTGSPKGVCLQPSLIQCVTDSLVAATAGLGVKTHLCLLPLATLLENIAGVYVPLTMGARVVAPPCQSLGVGYGKVDIPRLLQAIDLASPESVILVPELLRVLVQAIRGGWRSPPSLKFVAVGGGAVAPALLLEARRAGLPVFQGYGLSECASVVCLNTPGHNKPDSVGRPLPHARVRIADNSEICVSGAIMTGYLGDSPRQQTEIRTGDLGEIDADGFVYVRGRLKNMFISSMGRNVTPEWVERELICEPSIAQAMVSGEARPHPVALIAAGVNATEESIARAIQNANARLPEYAQIRSWAFFPEAPALANGLLTANGRLRRVEIAVKYSRLIESLYDHVPDTVHAIP